MEKNVLSKLYKGEEVQLAEALVKLAEVNIQLGAIDDLNANYKEVAAKVVLSAQSIASEANKISNLLTELNKVKDDAKKLIEMAKYLGADSVVTSSTALMNSADGLYKSWSKSISTIEQAVKSI